MILGVMADSHDNVPQVRRAVEVLNRRDAALVIHAGDFVAPFAVAPLAELRCRTVAVFGNNDGERVGLAAKFADFGEVHPNLAAAEVGGRRIAAVHYPELALPITAGDAYDVVIYGHTHEIDVRLTNGVLLLNPGEVGGWLTGRSTLALVDLSTMEVEIVDLGRT